MAALREIASGEKRVERGAHGQAHHCIVSKLLFASAGGTQVAASCVSKKLPKAVANCACSLARRSIEINARVKRRRGKRHFGSRRNDSCCNTHLCFFSQGKVTSTRLFEINRRTVTTWSKSTRMRRANITAAAADDERHFSQIGQ